MGAVALVVLAIWGILSILTVGVVAVVALVFWLSRAVATWRAAANLRG